MITVGKKFIKVFFRFFFFSYFKKTVSKPKWTNSEWWAGLPKVINIFIPSGAQVAQTQSQAVEAMPDAAWHAKTEQNQENKDQEVGSAIKEW